VSRLRAIVLVNVAVSLVTVVAWHAVRIATTSHAPTIKVRWKDTVTEAERRSLERAFQLVNGEQAAPNLYNYDLIDSRAPAIESIVEHPSVESTGDLDPRRFTVSTATDRGDTPRWLWHRWGRYDTGRTVAAIVHLWLVLSVVAWGTTRYGAAGVTAKRMMAQAPPR